jgi:hypothetical protein
MSTVRDVLADGITDPHSVWYWMLDIGVGLATLWLLGFAVIVIVGWLLDEPPARSPAGDRAAEARRLAEHKTAIDALYDRAEREVRRPPR